MKVSFFQLAKFPLVFETAKNFSEKKTSDKSNAYKENGEEVFVHLKQPIFPKIIIWTKKSLNRSGNLLWYFQDLILKEALASSK